MITQMNNIAEVWWNWMWPMFWQVSVLIILIGAFDFLLQKRVWPQIRYTIWLLVFIKLILPPTFSLSTSIISQARIKTEWMATQLIATNNLTTFSSAGLSSERNVYLANTDAESIIESEDVTPNMKSESHVETNSNAVAGTGVNVKLHWHSYAMVVWLIFMAALSLWVVVRFRKLRRFHTGKFSSSDLPQWFEPLFTQAAERLGLRRIPEITLSETISSPAVFGVFRPVLVLPVESINSLSQKRMEHILLHELAHIKRGDLLVNTFYMLLQIVYWFNPLLWSIRRRFQHIRELCCDATVARILREKTVDYRETILEVTQRYLAGSVEPGLGLLGMTEDSSRILIRLKWLQRKTWRYRGIRIAMIFIVVALMFVCVLPMARAKNAGALTVAADGSAKYSSIQEAIDAADASAVIRIGPGIYEEHLEIDKPVKLEGSGWDKTTIMTNSVGADAYEEAMRTLNTLMQEAKTDEQRKEIAAKFEAEFKEKYGKPTLLVSDVQNVEIRDLKVTSPGRRLEGGTISVPIVEFSNAKASVSKCVVIGTIGDGIHIFNGSDVEIRNSLVAAVWSTGIVVGEKNGESSSLRLLDSELRNCHYAGIRIRGGNDSTRLERCRISGAAWHGIRYDDCSPTIIGNRIFGNARCGIYASGKTTATVKGNIFSANEIVGMSCWFQNRDTVEGNTFAGNKRSGLEILGASKPIVKKNIFFSEPNGVQCANIGSDSSFALSDGIVTLEKNLFWNNEHNAVRRLTKTNTTEEITLEKQMGNVEMNPMFMGNSSNDFSLTADSPARRLGIGVAEPIGFESPWQLQPEEAAIIPDSQTRDYQQWKTPAKTASSQNNPAVSERRKASPVNPSDIALLYHREPDVRIKALKALAATNNSSIIDDLIRAHGVENYTPVHNEYDRVLQSLTGNRNVRGKSAWKTWLAGEVETARLKIEYLPVNPAADVQSEILAFVLMGPDDFDEMAAALTAATYDRQKCQDAIRYMVFNDHLARVREFLAGDWLDRLFAHQKININDLGYFLNGLANPGPLRKQINTHVRDCLDSENPTVVANALNLIAGVKGFSTRFTVPGVESKVEALLSSSVPEVAMQAKRALARVKPRKMTVPKSTITEVKDGLHIMALIDGKDTIKINNNELWYEHHSWNLPGKWWDRANNIKYDEPTYIDRVAWKPEWEGNISKPYCLEDAVPMREANNRIKLTKVEARGSVSIAEYPQQSNDYTLSILLDDNSFDAAQWYEFVIEWGQGESEKQGTGQLPAVLEATKETSAVKNLLQQQIDSATTGQIVVIPKGVYTEPVTITKSLTLRGESLNECVIEVTANEPAVTVDTKGKGKVIIEAVTVKWQLATSDRCEYPFAVFVNDSNIEIKNCCFQPLGNFKRSPSAIYSRGFSEMNINMCRSEGFEYAVCFGEGTKGTIRNSLVMDSGHQGIILYAGATVEITGNVVTGSRFHAVRNTGGTFNMTNNLVINNANRGIYLGNKSASGIIANNVIIGNGTGISGFARSNVKVENNIIADSGYAGISMRDSCHLSIVDNILRGNQRGLILFKEGGRNNNIIGRNTFWRNKVDTENMDKTSDSIVTEPAFVDAENGDFSLKTGSVLQHDQGLTNPEIFKKLWKIWLKREDKNVLFGEISINPN